MEERRNGGKRKGRAEGGKETGRERGTKEVRGRETKKKGGVKNIVNYSEEKIVSLAVGSAVEYKEVYNTA